MNKYLEALERLAMPDDIHIKECKKLGIGLTEDYDLLEQYILKTQEPRHYLKWEDLEWEELKTIVKKEIKVKLNGVEYGLEFTINYGIKEVVIFDKKNVLYAVFNECHKQFFNNLHLEVVENE